MHTLGSILAFTFNKLFALILIILILGAVPTMAAISTFTDKETVKSALADGQVYENITTYAFDIIALDIEAEVNAEFDPQSPVPNEADVPVEVDSGSSGDSETLRQVIERNGLIDINELIKTTKQILPADYLRQQTEGFLDGVYDYLDGTASSLEYSLSLQSQADEADKALRELLSSSLEGLEECTSEEQLPKDDEDFGIFDLTCLPPGGELEAEISEFISELTSDDGIFGEDFTQDDDVLSEVDLAFAKVAYEASNRFVVVFWFFLICLSVATIFTAKTVHRGFKLVGVIFFVSGVILMLVGSLVADADATFEGFASDGELSIVQEAAIEAVALPVFQEFTASITGTILFFGLIITVLGVGGFVLGIVLTRHHVDHLSLHKFGDDAKKGNVYPEPKKGPLAHLEEPEPEKEESKKPAAKKSTKKKSSKKIQ